VAEQASVFGMSFIKVCYRTDKGEPYMANQIMSDDGETVNRLEYDGKIEITCPNVFDVSFDARIKKFEDILILGVAGGSVIKTIVDEIKFKGKITGIEIDAQVVEIANKYFKLNEIKNLELVVDDAFEFVLKTKEKYDLIVIDIFQDTKMPNFLFEDYFINHVNSLLKINGFILFNTMVIYEKDRIRNVDYKKKFGGNYSLRMYPKVENHNELFTIKKLK
jgi:spermidine synthase